MENRFDCYNASGKFVCSYGLSWTHPEIMANAYNLADMVIDRVVLVIDNEEVQTVTREMLLSINQA